MMTTRSSHNSYDDASLIEFKSIEMIEDFINRDFFSSSKIYHNNEMPKKDENGIPKNFTQFIA